MGNGCSTILTSEVIHNIENKKESYDYKLYKRKVKHNSNCKTKKHRHKTPIITNNSIVHNDSTTINHNIKQFNLENKTKNNEHKLDNLNNENKNIIEETKTETKERNKEKTKDKIKELKKNEKLLQKQILDIETNNTNSNNTNNDAINTSIYKNMDNVNECKKGSYSKSNSDNKKIALLSSYIEDLEGELTDYSMQMVKMRLDSMNNDKHYKEQIKKLKSKNGKLFKSYIELKQTTNSY